MQRSANQSPLGSASWVLWPSASLLALLFAWAALVLPSRPGTALGGLAALLAASHALLLAVALLRAECLEVMLRVVGWFSLVSGATFVGAIAWSCVVLVGQFGSLGWGVSALLGAMAILLAAATGPFGIWALGVTRKAHAEK